MRPYGSAQQLERRRYRAMALLDAGHKAAEVARMVGVTAGALSQWKKRLSHKGSEALRAKPHPGPKPKLTAAQQQRLLRLLRAGPTRYGFRNELWTLSRVALVIRKEFRVRYNLSGVWHLLRRLGLSCQKPERRARERNEAAIEQWLHRDWPRIKKRPPERP